MGNTAATTAPSKSVFIRSSIYSPRLLPASTSHRRPGARAAKLLRKLRIPLAVQFHDISYGDAREQIFDIAGPQANATVRGAFSDAAWIVGSVNPVAFAAQPQPARPSRVVFARPNHCAGTVPGRICQPLDDLVGAARRGAGRRSNRG